MTKKTILISPLDWGLGHATESIPLIRAVRRLGFRALIGAAGRARELLRREFPDCEHLEFPAYDVRSSRDARIIGPMLRQTPRIIRSARAEHRLLNRLIDEGRIDGVISCSRFGLGSRLIPTVYLTHQIQIIAPPGYEWSEPLLRVAHRAVMKQYSEVWISDFPGERNLAGRLTGYGRPVPGAVYVGTLSRFNPAPDGSDMRSLSPGQDLIEILVILSGPEPQRSIFEDILVKQLQDHPQRSLIARGVTESRGRERRSEWLTLVDTMTVEELQPLLETAPVIISRTGYSTVMDLLALGRGAILTPTPGQTEQEYLGQVLRGSGRFHIEPQDGFDLPRSLDAVKDQPFYPPVNLLTEVVETRIKALFGNAEC